MYHISLCICLSLYIYCIYFILGYKPPKANWQLKSSTRSCKGSNIQFIEPQPRRDCQWRRGRRPPVTVGSGPLKFGKEIGPHPTGEPSLEGFRIPFFSQPFEVTLSIRQELHSTTSLTRNNKIPLLQTGWLILLFGMAYLCRKSCPYPFLHGGFRAFLMRWGSCFTLPFNMRSSLATNSGALKKQVQILRVP